MAISQGGTGAKTSQEAIYNLGLMPNENLPDNTYFIGCGSQKRTGQLPINQRGWSYYSNIDSDDSSIDRWKIVGANAIAIPDEAPFYLSMETHLTDSYIASLKQQFPDITIDKEMTISILVEDIVGSWGITLTEKSTRLAQESIIFNSAGLFSVQIPVSGKKLTSL